LSVEAVPMACRWKKEISDATGELITALMAVGMQSARDERLAAK